jgi:hypothetical protein
MTAFERLDPTRPAPWEETRVSHDGQPDSLDELRDDGTLSRLGLDPTEVVEASLIHEGHGSRLYRIGTARGSLILKRLAESAEGNEVQAYALLQKHSVPTLVTRGSTENAILLEDLESSPLRRLATAVDVESPAVGVAVAEWYRALHAAGRRVMESPEEKPSFLRREVDALTPATVAETGKKLGLAARAVWRLAADSIEALAEAMRALPETLNYNDFHWTNLALSRQHRQPLQAVVYDYHLLGIGLAYSDYRNVTTGLRGEAVTAFADAYGPVDEREALLDAPVSVLFGLSVAVQRPQLPDWSLGLIRGINDGELERDLRRAFEIL